MVYSRKKSSSEIIPSNYYKVGDFWSSRQRASHSLHEISYRACFKPQLTEYFITKFSKPCDSVADPFMGRGTSVLQAYLMGREANGNDINPLCSMLAEPRFCPPMEEDVKARMRVILNSRHEIKEDPLMEDLLVFYHEDTLSDLMKLKDWFNGREQEGVFDNVDGWIRMICLSRLTGHSPGFFSVRTMPPNQAVSAESQRKINKKNNQTPEPKNTLEIVARKTRSLLRDPIPKISETLPKPAVKTASSDNLFYLEDSSVDLIITSPPFMNIVSYRKDNWLRCWFGNIDANKIDISEYSSVYGWREFIRKSLHEMCRVVRPDGKLVIEVGEIRKSSILLEEEVVAASDELPVNLDSVMINQQQFTKTSNLWGIDNNKKGTNTNRIVLMTRAN